MNCGFSKEILALYVEDDLPALDRIDKVESHIAACAQCRQYCEELRKSQSFIKARFNWTHQQPVSQEVLTKVRLGVMSQLDKVEQSLNWTIRLERFFTLGLRRHRYAVACFAIVAVVSVSLLGQIRYSQKTDSPQLLVNNALLCPTSYREWVFVGSCLGRATDHGYESPAANTYHKVYIDPAAYREYERSGKFPEGTVMVQETLPAAKQASEDQDVIGLQVSVKNSRRFEGGWGFYDFTEAAGKLKPQADPLPQTAGCLACHREKAGTDHVFTQFYPALKSTI